MNPDSNLFLMCEKPNLAAAAPLPPGITLRPCRPNELELWKAFPFDDPETARAGQEYMTQFFQRVYAPKGDLFFRTCLFACNERDEPVGTCFLWPVHGGAFNSLHWFKVKKEYEGRGIGRALLSALLFSPEARFPLFLHTQPGSFRAIKLYSDFGFSLLTGGPVGHRSNDLEEALPALKAWMTPAAFAALRFAPAPQFFLDAARGSTASEF